MGKIKNIGVFGDSIFKGIQINPANNKYYVDYNLNEEILKENFSIEIKNYSSFGCTILKGINVIKKRLEKNSEWHAIIMDYGGNDCDYNWKSISDNPEGDFQPNTPPGLFVETYHKIIDGVRNRGILPIITTLPPLEPRKFFDWFAKDLNKENILKWLGDIEVIYRHQEAYSKLVEKIALDKDVPLIDLRAGFMEYGNYEELLCEDGTHPNTLGQKIIEKTIFNFAKSRLSAI